MKKTFIIMLICICLLLTACKTNPYAKDEETAMPSEITQDAASEQAESEQNTQAEKNQTSEQQKKAEIKEENLLPDEKEPLSSAPQEPEKIPPLVPIENGVYRRIEPFEGITKKGILSFSDYAIVRSLDEYTRYFNIEEYIIFKGIKKKDSTSVLTVQNGLLTDWYSETPIEVLESYYGDIQIGDEIIFEESAVVLGDDENKHIGCDDSIEVLKKNVEYILLFAKTKRKSEDGRAMYSYVSMGYSINEITDAHKKETEYTDKLGTSQFPKDVYTKYYYEVDKLDRRIDVSKETEKLNGKYGTRQLSDMQKELIDRLSKQYGAK